MATSRSRARAKPADDFEEVTEPEAVDVVQQYQDKAQAAVDAAHTAVKATPTEVAASLATAQVYATMANTEALRAWYGSA